MNDIYEIRRQNLARALQFPRVVRLDREKDKALLLGISSSMFSQAKNSKYRIGDDFARSVEAALGLESGWMDNDHTRLTLSQPAGLDAATLAEVIEVLEQEFRRYGHTFDPKKDAEYIALTYDYAVDSPRNVVGIGGFLQGLLRGRGGGKSEVGTISEEAGGALERRATAKA